MSVAVVTYYSLLDRKGHSYNIIIRMPTKYDN